MKEQVDSIEIIKNQHNLTNAIKGLKAFTDDKFTYLKNITINDLDALNGLVACIEIASRQQTDNIIEFFE
ncbi:hypothetical protein [Vagococcus carniphilus]|uniref:hypothetical protein n=1 Tax=Vagococcus carniphilus TaxID=218144 RepID=UPI00288C909E|nr:hypothetical protein [Vagococcus carniphilus]MDT2865443.1 hypothetical protein [Vagococcus carniphilus]